jgi:glyoxylase-like metal-dependent hydrolase (beta-lactamase superfamily II)
MTDPGAAYRVLAVRYAERTTTYGNAYHRWSSYGQPDGPLDMSYYFWVLFPVAARVAGGAGGGAASDGVIVIDTGFDPVRGEAMGRHCLCRPGEALALVGVDPASVTRLVISHMHYDHIGNIELFPHARISVSRTDYEFWAENPVAARRQFAEHTDPAGVNRLRQARAAGSVDLIDGTVEIAPGLSAREVGGHSPGQLIFEIAGEERTVALATDAVHYYAELEAERPFAVFSDLEQVYRAYDRVRELVSDGATLVPGHDPAVMERFRRVDGVAGEYVVSLTDRTTGSQR